MNDLQKSGTVVCFAAMRKELLLRNRLSPTVSERERRRLLLETVAEDDSCIAIPLFQAFVVYCYLNAVDQHSDIQQELIHKVSYASSYDVGKHAPLLVEISVKAFAVISELDMVTVVQAMSGKFQQELTHRGYERI